MGAFSWKWARSKIRDANREREGAFGCLLLIFGLRPRGLLATFNQPTPQPGREQPWAWNNPFSARQPLWHLPWPGMVLGPRHAHATAPWPDQASLTPACGKTAIGLRPRHMCLGRFERCGGQSVRQGPGIVQHSLPVGALVQTGLAIVASTTTLKLRYVVSPQFPICVLAGEPPLDASVFLIAPVLPSRNFAHQ